MNDEDELWVPLVEPREEECLEEWLAGASDSLAPASQSAEDLCADAFPTRSTMFGRHELPDFSRIPRARWEEAMRAIPERLREAAVRGLPLPMDDIAELMQLAWSDLPPAPSDRARDAVLRKPRMAPTPRPDAFRRANRQVNFRLTEDEYVDLATAAELIGGTPTQLAGMLVRNGVRRMIAEANRQDG